jgi:pimeloyl-ACP methyl ester carboxylesterase
MARTSMATLLSRHVDTSSSDYEKLKIEVEKADDEASRVSAKSLSKFSPLRNLIAAKAPTLALLGAADTLVPPPDEKVLNQLAAQHQFKLIVLPNVRHFPMLEDTTRFTRLLRDFLEAPNVDDLDMKDEWRRRNR